ncbi:hypothetical protein [Streptomyces sp. NBC_00557]|uniref:hypothetical protein n=1 Tax=Streptomyces sp. NBC_00557 TaxID=2975776 RepID=UPI002E8187BE|nr:hypothetical protein [Streptomyces sp. NBC_00557]WUC39702.1 hypothetical protein OG956_38745 [Streptomyces sp. NBC_00557]
MKADEPSFPGALEAWTDADWAEYRARIEDGEGSAAAIDAVNRRRRKPQTRQAVGPSAEMPE